MGKIIINISENINKEYEINNIDQLENIVSELQKNETTKIPVTEWQKELLTISAWTEDEIHEIEKAREFINQWNPKQFS